MKTNNISEILARNGLEREDMQMASESVKARKILETVARLLDMPQADDLLSDEDAGTLADARAILAEVLR